MAVNYGDGESAGPFATGAARNTGTDATESSADSRCDPRISIRKSRSSRAICSLLVSGRGVVVEVEVVEIVDVADAAVVEAVDVV